jgi:hypothetical protein
MGYKKTDALMRHLRDSGIAIYGPKQKRQLINTGYFHGYKGYRFFGNANKRLPFTSYDEVYATIQYDSDLKALFIIWENDVYRDRSQEYSIGKYIGKCKFRINTRYV